MRICTLASGSSGNCLYVESRETKILVDAGISLRQIGLKLRKLDMELSDIDAVIVTHEHSDHTAALRNIGVPVHVARATGHLWASKVSTLREFDTDTSFMIKDLSITPFSVPHDALDPVGFSIESGQGKKIGVVTDIGSVTALVRERLRGSDALVIEFNHDNDILLYSHYPWDLKQRIRGRLGHLSNNQASELLSDLVHSGLRHVVLAHLRQVNNRPEVAFESASSALRKTEEGTGVQISVAPRNSRPEMSSIWTDEAKYANWLRVEIAVCEAWAKYRKIPKKAVETIKKKAGFDVARINELEKDLKHDVISFLTSVSEHVGKESRYIHLGRPPSAVLVPASALQLREAAQIIIKDLEAVIKILKKQAFKYKKTPMIGRTHGIHAEPRTLGLVFALWYDEMKRNIDRMKRARDVVSVGKISGAVGN